MIPASKGASSAGNDPPGVTTTSRCSNDGGVKMGVPAQAAGRDMRSRYRRRTPISAVMPWSGEKRISALRGLATLVRLGGSHAELILAQTNEDISDPRARRARQGGWRETSDVGIWQIPPSGPAGAAPEIRGGAP